LEPQYRRLRVALVVVVAAAIASLGLIQLASYAFAASQAAAGTLPTRVALPFGLAIYRTLDAAAPAPYVEAELSAHALATGRPEAALRYALRLPASPSRDELLARIARARGDETLALEYFLAAPDPAAVQQSVDELARHDPAAAYASEGMLAARLSLLTLHPDSLAEVRWRMGELANEQAAREPIPSRSRWLRAGLRDLEAAVALAPLSNKYAIAAANQAILLGDPLRARTLFEQVVDANPTSADAVAGLGVAALRMGDRATAVAQLDRARRLDPQAGMVRALESALRARE
jgi:tetratricopeptide (TPR) repeat protein